VLYNGQHLDYIPQGDPAATADKPVVGSLEYVEGKDGKHKWQVVESIPEGARPARPFVPNPDMVFGKGRGGYRR